MHVPLCEDHSRHLVLIKEVLEDEGLAGKDLIAALQLEAQALIYPVVGVPRLYLLPGKDS